MYANTALFIIGFILSWVLTSDKPGDEPRWLINLVIVGNTGSCENKCYHIHHWQWTAVILILYLVIFTAFQGGQWNDRNWYLVSLYSGSAISEYIKFGNDIFIVTRPCFPQCRIVAK
jgi:hypothetical protein